MPKTEVNNKIGKILPFLYPAIALVIIDIFIPFYFVPVYILVFFLVYKIDKWVQISFFAIGVFFTALTFISWVMEMVNLLSPSYKSSAWSYLVLVFCAYKMFVERDSNRS
ncbi:MAG: hypothetical protein ABIG86_00220 [Patescibacteria group bacterium]